MIIVVIFIIIIIMIVIIVMIMMVIMIMMVLMMILIMRIITIKHMSIVIMVILMIAAAMPSASLAVRHNLPAALVAPWPGLGFEAETWLVLVSRPMLPGRSLLNIGFVLHERPEPISTMRLSFKGPLSFLLFGTRTVIGATNKQTNRIYMCLRSLVSGTVSATAAALW